MKRKTTFGVVHIGSIHTSVAIVAYRSPTDCEIIEAANKEIPLGEEIFHHQRLSFASIHELCRVLQGFRQLLADYGVTEVYPIATTAIREAENSLGILDLLKLRTGFVFHVADMTEEIYYKFFALHQKLKKNHEAIGKKPVLLLDVTSGGVGFTGWQNGNLLFQTNIASGRLSILEHFSQEERSDIMFPAAVRDYIHASLSPLWSSIEHAKIHTLVLSGFEARIFASLLAQKKDSYPIQIDPDAFLSMTTSLIPLTTRKLMYEFNLNEQRAKLLLPTLLLYEEVVRTMHIESILVIDTTFLMSYAVWCGAIKQSPQAIEEQNELLLGLAHSIAARYSCNLDHGSRIEEYAAMFFTALRNVHGLTERQGMLLRMSAILHEVGKFVNLRNYTLYSWQIILGTDIFGITDAEKEIIACIDYYYNKDNPDRHDRHYQELTRDPEIIADKCCAILRLADALDQGHSGKIKNVSARLVREQLIVEYTAEDDISLIRWTFQRASVLFCEIFGIEPVLRRK